MAQRANRPTGAARQESSRRTGRYPGKQAAPPPGRNASQPPGQRDGQRASGISGTWIAIAAVAAVAIVAAVVLLGRPSSDTGPVIQGSAPMTMGPDSAPVTIEVFADFQCPACKTAATTLEPQLKKEYVATGVARFVFRNYAFLGTESKRAAEAAVCAAGQDKFWEYHDKLMAEQKGENKGAFARANLIDWAQGLGMDRPLFTSCLDDGKARSHVQADFDLGRRLGVVSTPNYFVNGLKMQPGVAPFGVFKTVIDRILEDKK